MNDLLSDLLILLLLVVFVYGIKPIKPVSALNVDYLSIHTAKQYRGLFALMIVYHHLGQQIQTGFVFDDFAQVGFISVGFFFFLSGYGVQKSYLLKGEAYRKKFFARRIPSVLIPYLAVTVLYWIVNLLNGNTCSVFEVFIECLHGNPIVSYSWFIINILVFYSYYWVMMSVCKNHNSLFLVLGCVGYVLWVVLCLVMSYGSWWFTSTQVLIIGIFWAIYEKKILNIIQKNQWIIPCAWILSFALILFRKRIYLLPIKGICSIFDFVNVICFSIGVIFFSMKFKIGNKVLDFLGGISLEIYLIHGLFILLYRSNILYIKNDFIWSVLVMVCSICTGYLLHWGFGKLKVKQKSAK